MEKKYARLAALLAAAVLCGNGAPSMAAGWWVGNGKETITITAANASDITGGVHGNRNNSDGNGIVTGHVEMTGGTVTGHQIYGGWADDAWNVKDSTVKITSGTVTGYVYGGYSGEGSATYNTVEISGDSVNTVVYGGVSDYGEVSDNTVRITDGTVTEIVCGGAGDMNANKNSVTITGGTVTGVVCGGMGHMNANKNSVTITGGTVTGDVYGGYSDYGKVSDNKVALSGSANVMEASLHGSNKAGSENTLLIDGWSGRTEAVKNFNEIQFQHLSWQKDPVLTITVGDSSDLNGTKIAVEDGIALAGGQTFERGESMTLIRREGSGGLEVIDDLKEEKQIQLTAGVTTELAGTLSQKTGGLQDVVLTIDSAQRSGQTDLVGENRLAGAAFVNQGADIAADSLRLLDDGYHFGTQTFGAVYGNRSQYDVASDIKINGWSEIAGFGNIHEVKGGRLAWGVFYENGTGNYRTWNTFNNEMFRGDGSLLYNGGGAAVRLTKDSGMYYEASLRAGTLSSSMSNAVKDGNGNSYGFDSDSTYWGAHVGAGKLIQRGSGQWDIYGKYFHTDIDGDSFEMGGDRFSFDSVTSDRLRLGARYTADTDKAWSLYCGAAYEYEFSGDSRMKAGQFEAPEQSLQGSTVFGEIGTVWGRKDSPWSMDINLRGYAGEREGFSGMVQLAYAF